MDILQQKKLLLLGIQSQSLEKNAIGGCCLNVGCIPSKVYLQYSHWLSAIDTANTSGLTITVDNIDFPSIVKEKITLSLPYNLEFT